MTEDEASRLRCENAYLTDRCAQLESRIAELNAQVLRMQENLVRPGQPRGRWHGAWLSTDQ